MATSNIFEVVIGRGVLKWDAVWRVLEWLCDPQGGHGLGETFRDALGEFCLGCRGDVETKVEFFLGHDESGNQKWPDLVIASPSIESPERIALIDDISNISPNNSRKINNLATYSVLAAQRFPSAARVIVAVTDTLNEDRFTRLNEVFADSGMGQVKLLPLQVVANWIDGELASPEIRSFREWASSL